MADLHIVREHTLGLAKARKIAFKWAAQAETEFGMACSYTEGEAVDEVSFSRSGVKGTLDVDATRFELRAHLGFLLGAFKQRIEAEIVKNLDTLLAAPMKKRVSKKAG
ncbi:polyhydroxyalkanoic acid system family protein [Rhodoferax sp. 4810]|nr:polyhydroxyalkanoic acid system family protein [Rhodoferax jenense]